MLSFFVLLNTQTSFALEAMDPMSLCNRMVIKTEKDACELKAKRLKLDWYAATACNALSDDKKFINCWNEISGAEFNPDSLSRCVENPDDQDDSVLNCIVLLKNKRVPASIYQSLEVKKINRSKDLKNK